MSQAVNKILLLSILALSFIACAQDGAAPKPAGNTESRAPRCADANGEATSCSNSEIAPRGGMAAANECTDLEGNGLPCPDAVTTPAPAKGAIPLSLGALPGNLLLDQKAFWTSPARLRQKDIPWLLPFAALTTAAVASDTALEPHLPESATLIRRSNDVSNAGVAALVGAGGGLYLWGVASGAARPHEAGLLSGEAALNSLAVTNVLKYSLGRARPLEGDGAGQFWRGSDSFPSEHAAVAWSVAAVLANEYRAPLAQLLVYGLAGGVTLTRMTSRQHFPSDAIIGSALGWYIGRQVYRTRNASAPEDSSIGVFQRASGDSNSSADALSPEAVGSTYVPLDSWIYDAVQRLAAMGVVNAHFLGLRPWTRLSVAQVLADANTDDLPADSPAQAEAGRILLQLQAEFADEAAIEQGQTVRSIRLESVYSRSAYLGGRPLNDSYHFGQTVIDDYGRPYQQGFNQITGLSARAQAGRFAFYVRGEYQHAPSAAAYPLSVRQVIAQVDEDPLLPATPFQTVNQFTLLDSYLAVAALGQQFSFGKQSLWWGPDTGDAMIMSNNAEPMYMFRIDRTTPVWIPGLSRLVGPFRYDNFFGMADGHHFPPNPIIYGNKVSFKPTPNLEFGFSRTAVFAGEGLTPLTLSTFLHSFFSVTSGTGPGMDLRRNPGARHANFDFSYRLPGLRDWLTLYSDSVVHDDISPIDVPHGAAINPGMFLAHFPKVPKLSFRAEAVNTDPPVQRSNTGQFIYWETLYHDAHTNDGNLLGSWIGREGKGIQAWATYSLTPMSMFQLGYRNAKVAKDFIPGGETANNYTLRARLRLQSHLELETVLQYETWKAPVLAPGRQSDVLGSVQLTFWPQQQVKTVH